MILIEVTILVLFRNGKNITGSVILSLWYCNCKHKSSWYNLPRTKIPKKMLMKLEKRIEAFYSLGITFYNLV